MLNTTELAKLVQEEIQGNEKLGLKLNQTQSRAVVDTVFEAVTKAIVEHEGVRVTGFGDFTRKFKEAGVARNPKSGEEVTTEAKHLPKFKALAALKEAVK